LFFILFQADSDFALCGTSLWGCASLPPIDGGYKAALQLGTLDELGTPSQQWIYQDGLLKPKVQPTIRSRSSGGESCLAPSAEELTMGRSYPLTLQDCPKDDDDDARHMRFLVVDGSVQSLASVVLRSSSSCDDSSEDDSTEESDEDSTEDDSSDEDSSEDSSLEDDSSVEDDSSEDANCRKIRRTMNTDEISTTPRYCMSINGNVAMESAGSAITLEPCDSQNKLQQGLQSYGTVHPFVYSLQRVWGYSDVVELAFAVAPDGSNNDPVVTVNIYNQLEEIVHSLQATTVSGILSFPVSDLMGEDNDSTTIGEYIVKLETDSVEYSVAFSVVEESQVAYTSFVKDAGTLAIVMAAAGLVVVLILVAAAYYSFAHRKQVTMGGEVEATAVEKMEDINDDAAETLSQATTSNDSNDSMDRV
jgi:hypothetical protein